MNSLRSIGHASKPLCGQRIAVGVAWERVASRRGANFLQPFLQRGRPVLARCRPARATRYVRNRRKQTFKGGSLLTPLMLRSQLAKGDSLEAAEDVVRRKIPARWQAAVSAGAFGRFRSLAEDGHQSAS